jgi:hypothetical protein
VLRQIRAIGVHQDIGVQCDQSRPSMTS